jgi:Skp family chaperone for outer membrane proteins
MQKSANKSYTNSTRTFSAFEWKLHKKYKPGEKSFFSLSQDKLRKAIDDLAQKEGYDYIFNNSNATGVAFLLHASKEHDVTKRLLQQLGIPVDSLPEEKPQ